MSSETLIFDTIVATIPIDATQLQTAGAAAPPSEHEKVEALLRRICDPHREQTFIICGRAFDVLHAGPGNPSTGTTFKPRDNAGCEAHIVLCPQTNRRSASISASRSPAAAPTSRRAGSPSS